MRKTHLLTVAMALLANTALAQNAIIDYQGYAWETGGFPPSNSGDVLSVVGIVDAIDPRFGVNFSLEEVTLYASNLVSGGQVDLGGGLLSISYSGGNLDLYRDPAKNHDYGVNPANATAPSTFVDGALFLGGTFSSFFLFLDTTTGSGAYEGNVAFTSGSGLATLNQIQANGYTFGGVLNSAAAGGNVPAGYDLQVDGTIEVEVIVGVEQKSWGAVKRLYQR
jgi:hypothetical protein